MVVHEVGFTAHTPEFVVNAAWLTPHTPFGSLVEQVLRRTGNTATVLVFNTPFFLLLTLPVRVNEMSGRTDHANWGLNILLVLALGVMPKPSLLTDITSGDSNHSAMWDDTLSIG